MRNFLIVSVCLLLSALSVAMLGCGGDNGGANSGQANAGTANTVESRPIQTTVKTSPRSKAEFLRLAEAICGKSSANQATEVIQYAKEHQRKGVSNNDLGIEAYRAMVMPKLRPRIEELRALGAPKGDEKRVEAILASIAHVVNAPDRTLFRELHRSSILALRYGIPRCAA